MTIEPAGRDHDGTKPFPICGGNKRNGGGVCTQKAGWGTDHPGYGRCKLHGGATQSHQRAARKEQLRAAARKLGTPKDVDVETAMLDLIREAAGNVDFYRSLIQELEQGRRLVRGADEDVLGDEDLDVDDVLAEIDRRPSIAGRVKVDSLEGKPHVFVVMYNEERDRLQRYLHQAASLGIQARRVEAAEQQGRMIVAVLRAVTADLGLSTDQRQLLPGLVRKHWEAITASAVA